MIAVMRSVVRWQWRHLPLTPITRRHHYHCHHQRHFATTAPRPRTIRVNNRDYRVPGSNEILFAILLDGSSMDYIDRACQAGAMPNLMAILGRSLTDASTTTSATRTIKYQHYFTTDTSAATGMIGLASGVMPSFTNPNNVSVITGVAPHIHGISGNYYYDKSLRKEISMTDPTLMRAQSILNELNQQGVSVTVVTVKDKLAKLLGYGLDSHGDSAHALSMELMTNHPAKGLSAVERVEQRYHVSLPSVRAAPSIYSPECSIRALEAARDLTLASIKGDSTNAQFFYVSSTDYVQHRYEPGTAVANEFYKGLDNVIGDLHRTGRVRVALTADHGMNDKYRESDGSARCIYVENELNGIGIDSSLFRIILPITDPHVKHHGNLGSYACIYVNEDSAARPLTATVMSHLRSLPGIYTVMSGAEAAHSLELPEDRIGDIVVIGDRHTVLGRHTNDHRDQPPPLRLRSHGGLDEMQVPMFVNFALDDMRQKQLMRGKLRNFDMFDLLLNAPRAGQAVQEQSQS